MTDLEKVQSNKLLEKIWRNMEVGYKVLGTNIN